MHIQEGRFTIIRGPQRSGKTLLMSIMALEAHQKSRPIFTNIAYTFPYDPLYFQELDLNEPSTVERIQNSTITLDELWMILDCRSGMTRESKKFSRWLYQVKKQGVNLIGTLHDLSLIDRRARENFDYLIDVQALPRKRPVEVPPEALHLRITNGPLQPTLTKSLILPVKNLIGLYDTTNVFDPLEPPPGFKQSTNQNGSKKPSNPYEYFPNRDKRKPAFTF